MTSTWIEGKALRTSPLCAPASEKVFAMLVAYMDDSGTHDGSHNSVLGGYWGSINEWRRFERAWKAVLDSEGIEEFHAKSFWPRIPGKGRPAPYTGWSDERHAHFIDRLLRIIESTKIVPFGSGFSPSEWNKLPDERVRLYTQNNEKRLQKPLNLPLYRIVHRVASYCHPHKTMHFVMDLDTGKPSVQEAMLSLFASIKSDLCAEQNPLSERIGGIGFEDSVKAPPLQAADLLVYEAHRYLKQANGNPYCPVRKEYRRALRRFRSHDDFWFFDDKRLRHLNQFVDSAGKEEQQT